MQLVNDNYLNVMNAGFPNTLVDDVIPNHLTIMFQDLNVERIDGYFILFHSLIQ